MEIAGAAAATAELGNSENTTEGAVTAELQDQPLPEPTAEDRKRLDTFARTAVITLVGMMGTMPRGCELLPLTTLTQVIADICAGWFGDNCEAALEECFSKARPRLGAITMMNPQVLDSWKKGVLAQVVRNRMDSEKVDGPQIITAGQGAVRKFGRRA